MRAAGLHSSQSQAGTKGNIGKPEVCIAHIDYFVAVAGYLMATTKPNKMETASFAIEPIHIL